MRYACLLLLISVLLSLSACRPKPLEDALLGRLPPEDNNRIITEYCQSCHIHRAFDDLSHVPQVQALYDRAPYTEATQCRACHLVHKNTWGERRRKTLWPAEVAQGTDSTSSSFEWFKRLFQTQAKWVAVDLAGNGRQEPPNHWLSRRRSHSRKSARKLWAKIPQDYRRTLHLTRSHIPWHLRLFCSIIVPYSGAYSLRSYSGCGRDLPGSYLLNVQWEH